MLYIAGKENKLAPGVAELHMQQGEDLTIIFPEGNEITILGEGIVFDGSGKRIL